MSVYIFTCIFSILYSHELPGYPYLLSGDSPTKQCQDQKMLLCFWPEKNSNQDLFELVEMICFESIRRILMHLVHIQSKRPKSSKKCCTLVRRAVGHFPKRGGAWGSPGSLAQFQLGLDLRLALGSDTNQIEYFVIRRGTVFSNVSREAPKLGDDMDSRIQITMATDSDILLPAWWQRRHRVIYGKRWFRPNPGTNN